MTEPGELPNLIVIGGQKCGTSSLHSYLGAHPEIAMSTPKELNFFGGPGFANWDRGLDWYRAQFAAHAPVRGESSPSYTAYPFVSGVPARMHAAVPEARLVYVVRDPIERLLSQYVHVVARGAEPRSLARILTDRPPEHTPYVTQSLYWMQLEQYLELFAPERVLVVDQADLASDRATTISRIFGFLEVDDAVESPAWERRLNRSSDKRRPRRLLAGPAGRAADRLLRRLPEPAAAPLRPILTRRVERPALDPSLRERLAEIFHPDAERLRAHTGQGFADWSV